MVWPWLRTSAAIVGLSGVLAGLIVNIDRATRQGQDLGLVLSNFFSLFTIVTTTLSAIVLIAAATWSRRNPGSSPEPRLIAVGLAAVTGPVVLLGIVYNVLLRGLPSAEALADSPVIHALDTWAVEVLHVVMPLYFLADLFLAPRRRSLRWSSLAVILGYPLAWITYTMIRGELVPSPDGTADWWYPYPFLDPHGDGGYVSVLAYVGVMLVGLALIGVGIIVIGRFRAKRAAARAGSTAVDAAPA